MEEKDSHKIVMLGASGVGKTSIVLQLQEKVFKSMVTPTVGSGVIVKEIPTIKGSVALRIWDTAGEERYRSFTGLYSQAAVAGVIVFDISDQESFDCLEEWIDLFKNSASPDALLYLAGNKIDLMEGRVITFEEGQKFAVAHDMKYYEVSAKSGENVDLLFNDIATKLGPKNEPSQMQHQIKTNNGDSGCSC